MKFLRTHRDALMGQPFPQDLMTLVFFDHSSKKEFKEESKILDEFGGTEQRFDSLKMETRDASLDFTSDNSDFVSETEIIKLHRKLNLKLRAMYDKENKSFLIDKVFSALSLCDILFESLEDFIGVQKFPADYCYKTIHALRVLKNGLEVYQVFALENYFFNVKRALL